MAWYNLFPTPVNNNEPQTVKESMTKEKESDYTNYVKGFKNLFEAYDKSARYLDLSEEFQFYVNKKRSWVERLSSPEFPVAFLGAFSAGKSTIINAILGEDILPEATGPKTAIPTLLKKGGKNRALIFYLDAEAKQELKNLYIEELSKDLRKKAEEYSSLHDEELVKKLDHDIAEAKKLGNFNKEESFNELQTLIAGWNKHSGQDISIPDLPKYVTEEYEDVLFVDKVEVYLTDMNIPENVVLVDLPGLGVVNPRHRKITKAYVENDAKAFVVSSKMFSLLQGEELELLTEIHKQRPKVLQRAFWVMNQWDRLDNQHKKETSADFEDTVKRQGFNISSDRVFKVSALNYLLLKLIQDGKLESSQNAKKHLDNLQKSELVGKIPDRAEAGKYLSAVEEVKNFAQFKTKLFDYLEHTAKAEFFEEAKGEYVELAAKLQEAFAPLYDSYKGKDDESLRNSFIAGELSQRLEESLKTLREIVTEQVEIMRVDVTPGLVFWTDENRNQLEEQIKVAISNLDRRDLKNELLKGMDLDYLLSRLPEKIEKRLRISEKFRENLQQIMEENVVRTYLHELLIVMENTDTLPEKFLQILRNKLNGRELLARLRGVCDTLLFPHGETVDKLGDSLLGRLSTKPGEEFNSQNLDESVGWAIDFYKSALIEFVNQLQQQTNKYIRRSLKNYFEELERELLNLFETKRSDIAKVIMAKIVSEVDDRLGTELEKQKVIKEAYQVFSAEL